MSCYINKSELYKAIDGIKTSLGIDIINYPIDTISLCNSFDNITLGSHNFNSSGLRGMVYIAQTEDESNVILLNEKRNKQEQNFDCTHEYMHVNFHSNTKTKAFRCYDKIHPAQDPFLEWQANESAAEFLLPYKEILLQFKYTSLKYSEDIKRFKEQLCECFNVPPAVVAYRLESLKYEMWQQRHGISIENIIVLSKHQQELQNINVLSLNDLEKRLPNEYKIYINNNSINPTFFKGNSWRP